MKKSILEINGDYLQTYNFNKLSHDLDRKKPVKCLYCHKPGFIFIGITAIRGMGLYTCHKEEKVIVFISGRCEYCHEVTNFDWFIHEECLEALKIAPDRDLDLNKKIDSRGIICCS